MEQPLHYYIEISVENQTVLFTLCLAIHSGERWDRVISLIFAPDSTRM